MIAIGLLFVRMLCDCFKSRRRLEAEILILRHQLNVLRRAPRRGLNLCWVDRALFIWLYRCCPRILDAMELALEMLFPADEATIAIVRSMVEEEAAQVRRSFATSRIHLRSESRTLPIVRFGMMASSPHH
jgi:hypothetical protein